jgi:phage baseplate assembly protein W
MYERPFQPGVGSRLREMLFEPYDVFLAEDLKEEITNVVTRFEPRVILNEVRVLPGENENSLNIEVDYTIVGETLVQTVDFLLERT